ncbi:MAG TPA: SpoIIE family protein phosphatase [Solirubrobacteraceae bacterium]
MPESPALLDALFTHAPVGLTFWDVDLRYRRINEALAAINGRSVAEHVGRTPVEVLGEELGAEVEQRLERVLATGAATAEPVEVTGATPAQPGVERHWLVSYYPVVDGAGETLGVAGAVIEVTELRRVEAERGRALKDALVARAHAQAAQLRAEEAQRASERARERTEFLAEAGRRMATSMDFETTLQEVAEITVPAIADWCTITIRDAGGELRTVAAAHTDPARTSLARELADRYRPRLDDVAGAGHVITTGEPELVDDVPDALLITAARDREHLEILRGLGLRASLVVPLRTADAVIGALALAMAESGRSFDSDDASLAQGLAARAALHIRNAQLYTERSHIAKTLQAGLLPRRLPEVPHVEVAARYLAAGDQNDVGGDFYDVFPTGEEGVWAALIGDVTGKGPEAAALTSLVRHTLRTAAIRDADPIENLQVLNRAMLADTLSTRFCTVVYARVCPSPGSALVTVATGGHPPPLVLRAGGELERVDVRGSLVGGVEDPEFATRTLRLHAGDVMVLYTDGVTELRTRDPSYGDRRLAETLLGHAGRDAAEIADAVQRTAVALQSGPPRDDIALLVLRVR